MPERKPKYLDLEGLKYYDQWVKEYINQKSFYPFPEGGIPSSDLDQEVQESLAKADSAIQPSDVISEITEDSNSPISSGAIYNMLSTLNADLEDIKRRLSVLENASLVESQSQES